MLAIAVPVQFTKDRSENMRDEGLSPLHYEVNVEPDSKGKKTHVCPPFV